MATDDLPSQCKEVSDSEDRPVTASQHVSPPDFQVC